MARRLLIRPPCKRSPRMNANLTEDTEMKATLKRFVLDRSGQDLIEYGLLIGIVTIAAITAIALIGPKVAAYFTTLNSMLP